MIIATMEKIACSILRRNIYAPVLKLQGPKCPNTLALSPLGRQLASGGPSAPEEMKNGTDI